jgi:hypothetical protein
LHHNDRDTQRRKKPERATVIDTRHAGTDRLTSSDECNLAEFHQATAAFHSLNALILRIR